MDGVKTETRRVDGRLEKLEPGDRLWVREMWRPVMEGWTSYVEYKAGGMLPNVNRKLMSNLNSLALRFPGAKKELHSEAWKPSIHMPRWACRLYLVVTEKPHWEPLQHLGAQDAINEGVNYMKEIDEARDAPVHTFMHYWDIINGKRSIAYLAKNNPDVLVVKFSVGMVIKAGDSIEEQIHG